MAGTNHTVSELTHRVQANEISTARRRNLHNKKAVCNSACDIKDKLNERSNDSFPTLNRDLRDKGGSIKRANNIFSKIKSMRSISKLESIKGHTSFDDYVCHSINGEVHKDRSHAETMHDKAKRRSSFPSSFPAIFKHEANDSNKLIHNRKASIPDDKGKGKKSLLNGKKNVCKPKKDYFGSEDDNYNSMNDEANENRSKAETKHFKARRRRSLQSSFPPIFKHEANVSNKLTHGRKISIPDDQVKGNTLILNDKKNVCKPKKDYSRSVDDQFLFVDKNVDTFLIASEKTRVVHHSNIDLSKVTSYVELFEHDKNFVIADDGWVDLAEEEERKNAFQRVCQISRTVFDDLFAKQNKES